MTNLELYLYSQLRHLKGQIDTPSKYQAIQALVRSNTASDFFTVHESQLTGTRNNDTLTWDILGINHDAPANSQYTRSMTLQLHDQFPTVMQFDAPEAFYYCETELPVGTYHFKIDPTYDATYNSFKDTGYQFTLTKPVPAGGQLTFPWEYNAQASAVKVSSYDSGSATTAIESVAVTSGTGGQGLGALVIAGDFANNLNSIHRVRYGSNNYKESAIRQWLNSSAAAGSVWKPQTKWDRPPAWAATTAGFMNGMGADFLAVIGKTHIIVARNTVCEGGGYDEMDDYFFLLSRREVYMGNEVASVIEGEPYPYYSDYSDHLSAPGTINDSNRVKYRGGNAQWWWLRTPSAGHGYVVRNVNAAGAMNIGNAHNSSGVAPACNII